MSSNSDQFHSNFSRKSKAAQTWGTFSPDSMHWSHIHSTCKQELTRSDRNWFWIGRTSKSWEYLQCERQSKPRKHFHPLRKSLLEQICGWLWHPSLSQKMGGYKRNLLYRLWIVGGMITWPTLYMPKAVIRPHQQFSGLLLVDKGSDNQVSRTFYS